MPEYFYHRLVTASIDLLANYYLKFIKELAFPVTQLSAAAPFAKT